MRVIVLNRKRLGVTIIIIGLMLVLFGFEKNFDGRLKYVTLMQNNINSLKQYEALNNKFSYKLPSRWTTKEYKFGGGEIIYHNEFSSEDAIIHGMVEVWDSKEDLKVFLDKSKNISNEFSKNENYNITPININKHEGYLLTYSQLSGGKRYQAYEYFLRNSNKFIRFSFFVREDNFKENMPTIFKTIVETFSYRNSN